MEIKLSIRQGLEKAYKNDKGIAYAPWFVIGTIKYKDNKYIVSQLCDTEEEALKYIYGTLGKEEGYIGKGTLKNHCNEVRYGTKWKGRN